MSTNTLLFQYKSNAMLEEDHIQLRIWHQPWFRLRVIIFMRPSLNHDCWVSIEWWWPGATAPGHQQSLYWSPGNNAPANVSSHQWLNSSPPSAAYMRQWTESSLVQVMACRLFGTKPLPEPMLAYCQLDSWEQISVKFELALYHSHSRKCIWKCRLPKQRPCCPVGEN